MKFTLLTYNLFHNKAVGRIREIVEKENPDILCFQEIATDVKNFESVENLGYKLADYSNFLWRKNTIFGIAIFYKANRFVYVESNSINLPHNFIGAFLQLFRFHKKSRDVLKANFVEKEKRKKFIIYNVHLTAFSTNKLRKRQIKNVLPDLKAHTNTPIIVAGDFNYPYGRRYFEDLFSQYDLQEATKNIFFTYKRRILLLLSLTFKNDYILYKNLKEISTKRLDIYESDHFPILSEFEID